MNINNVVKQIYDNQKERRIGKNIKNNQQTCQ